MALGKEPQDLPPGPLIGLFGGAVPVFEFVDAQIGLEVYVSCHAQILPQPTPEPYKKVLTLLRGTIVARGRRTHRAALWQKGHE